jgi:hypothetical protein
VSDAIRGALGLIEKGRIRNILFLRQNGDDQAGTSKRASLPQSQHLLQFSKAYLSGPKQRTQEGYYFAAP